MEAKLRFYTNKIGAILCVIVTFALIITAFYLCKFHVLFESAFFGVIALILLNNADEAKRELQE